MHCKSQTVIPKCSLYAKTFKKTQIPVYDAFGPFPDEPLMSGIDRVLFFFGGGRVQKYFNSEYTTIEQASKSGCSSVVKFESCCKDQHNKGFEKCLVRNSPTYSVIQNCKCCQCDVCPQKSSIFRDSRLSPRICIKENTSSRDSKKIGIPLRALKRSFSLCSLACRKLKEKLSLALPSTMVTPIIAPHWLWTKVENYSNGCQVYEIFKNSTITTHPTKFDTCRASKIIFVILPTGIIMPFETLPRH
ncbi:hypothetical protein FF38_09430 [Lucilia cuprina]|uniref:Uncharacterized protein n=1 Tax=Lucilia cuprina TaxID=7375 RepID=A0A0L0C8E1_LUCCU|nr:hypothetical protein CVS40_4037 [Lucilia cuprina]KNC28708.1 hypothetical protein FF38_09430 [Lucilia cuprina]